MRNSPGMELMDVSQVHSYLGGNIGLNKITELMKNNNIPTIEIGGKRKLVTRKRFVDLFIDNMFAKPIQNGIIDTMPRSWMGVTK